ncbi:uncharacterized protein LOC144711370 [Wolffia australiana]
MKKMLLLLLLVTMAAAEPPPTSAEAAMRAALRSNGLPIGLLPRAISSFEISPDGRFQALLAVPCNAQFENQVHYDANITGTLSLGRISHVGGISAEDLFLWFPVNAIRVDFPSSGVVYFDVGVVSKQFSLSLFQTPPDCWAALDQLKLGFLLSPLEVDQVDVNIQGNKMLQRIRLHGIDQCLNQELGFSPMYILSQLRL